MRFGGLSDVLTILALALGGWLLAAGGAFHPGSRSSVARAAETRAVEAGSVRACASYNCPVIRVIEAGDAVRRVRGYGYGWFAVVVTDAEGHEVQGVIREP